jgi:hypothetical protein
MLIKDLSIELDVKAMRAVRGGNNGTANTGTIGQGLAIAAPVMMGVAGPANTNIGVSGSQYGAQYTYQHAGDAFLAFFPFVW